TEGAEELAAVDVHGVERAGEARRAIRRKIRQRIVRERAEAIVAERHLVTLDATVDGEPELVTVVPGEPRGLVAPLHRPPMLAGRPAGVPARPQRRGPSGRVRERRRDENSRIGESEVWIGMTRGRGEREVGFI